MRDTGPSGLGFGQPESSAYVPDALGGMRVALYSLCGLGIGRVGRPARILRVVVSDMADFERLHKEALTQLPGVARVNSSVAIRTVQKKTELPLR